MFLDFKLNKIMILQTCLLIISLIILRKIFRKYKLITQTIIIKDTTILITGGCMGIGRQIIKHLSNYNCKIINLDIREEDFIEVVKDNNNVINYKCDLSKRNDIDTIFNTLRDTRIDILINNAAVAFNRHFDDVTIDMITQTTEVNLLASMILCKKVIDKMNSRGHIVNIASVMSHATSKKSSLYVMSKWGLYGFHENLHFG
jgi:all-trans-retinol dehydrogenase (NAD+)